jgi:hypothetical protein
MKEYILCAAIHHDDGKEHVHQPKNIISGFVVCGRRHHNCYITTFILNGEESVQKKVRDDKWKIEQGFITNTDRFVNRKEGGVIAFNANQTDKLQKILFSEHLY